jgi:hypothetical protein
VTTLPALPLIARAVWQRVVGGRHRIVLGNPSLRSPRSRRHRRQGDHVAEPASPWSTRGVERATTPIWYSAL